MIETLNNIANTWYNWQLNMLWQVGTLIIIVAAIDALLRKWAWPQVRYAMWLLVLVKLIIWPGFALSTSVISPLTPIARQVIQQPASGEIATEPFAPEITPFEPATTTKAISQVAVESTPQFPAEIPATSLIWKSYLLMGWSVGILLLGSCILLRLRHLQRGIGAGTSDLPKKFQQLLNETAKQLNLRRKPRVILSSKVVCPAVFGLFRPKLLMPADSIEKLSEDELRHHLMHELAHIKRGDLFFHAVYMFLQIAYWFNPLLWMVGRQLQHLREVCCDATVARILREKTVHYRETLLETARRLLAEPVEPGMGLLGLFEDSNRLLIRLQWLEKKTWKFRPLQIVSVIAVVVLMLACILPMAQGKKEIVPEIAKDSTVDKTATNELGSLAFRIVPKLDELPEKEIKRYRDDLKKNGPTAAQKRSEKYAWFEAKEKLITQGFIELYKNKPYILLHNHVPHIMVPQQGWMLADVTITNNSSSMPSFGYEFNNVGADLFGKITCNNLQQSLAILVNDIVYTAPTIQSEIRSRGVITGRFSRERAVTIITAMVRGMMLQPDGFNAEKKIQQLIQEWDWKSQKYHLTDEVKANAQKTADMFLNALKNKDWNLVRSMLDSGSIKNRYTQYLPQLKECIFDQVGIDAISIHAGKNAVVHTRGLKQANGGNLQMRLELVKMNNVWVVDALKLVTGKVLHSSEMIIAGSMLMELKKLFESVYAQMDSNPKTAIAAMDEFLTEIEKFEKNIKGSPVEQVFLMATDQARQARAALDKGEIAKAKAIFETMGKAGPGFEEVMKNAIEQDKAKAPAKPTLQQKSQKMVAMLVMLGNMSASVDDALGKGDKDIALALIEQISAQIPGTIAMAKGTPFEAMCDMMKQQFDSCHQAIKKGELKKAQTLIHALQGMGSQMREMIEKPVAPAVGKGGSNPKKAAAMLDGLKAMYGAAYVALMENNDPKGAMTALESLIPQMDQFEKHIAGTPDASSIAMGIKMVRQMHKALKDGNLEQARNIMKQLDKIGEYLENIVVKMGDSPAKLGVKPPVNGQGHN